MLESFNGTGIFLAQYYDLVWPIFSTRISTAHCYLLMSANYSFCGWPQGSNLSPSPKGLPEALWRLCRAMVRETQRDRGEKIWNQYKVAPALVCSWVGLEGGSCAWALILRRFKGSNIYSSCPQYFITLKWKQPASCSISLLLLSTGENVLIKLVLGFEK